MYYRTNNFILTSAVSDGKKLSNISFVQKLSVLLKFRDFSCSLYTFADPRKQTFFPSNVAACALGNLQAHQLLIVQIGFISPLRSSMHVTRNNYGFSVYSILGWEVLYVVRKHKGD